MSMNNFTYGYVELMESNSYFKNEEYSNMLIFFTIFILKNITILEYIFFRICLENAGWKDADIDDSILNKCEGGS